MNSLRVGVLIRDAVGADTYLGSDVTSMFEEVVVIKRQSCGQDGSLKVTFVLNASDKEGPISVCKFATIGTR